MIRAAIQRPVTISMFILAVSLFGYISLDRLALNLLPDISYPTITIQTEYQDAAPEEVENLITRPIEEAVGVLPGLTRLSSVSRSGQSEVVLEFNWGTKMDLASLEAREKLDVVQLPRDARRPVILRFDPSYDPIMRLRLSAAGMSLSRLRYSAEKELKKLLESTDGVAAIKVIGGLEEQIHIEIDEKKLAELGVPIADIGRILSQENLNQASGSLYDLDANYLVRILSQFRSVEEIRNIVIRNQDGRRIVLGDVALVERGTKDREIIARLDGKESVELAIYKEADANTVTVAGAVKDKLDSLKKAGLMPKGLEYKVVFNQAEFIKMAIDDVLDSAIAGGILAILVLFLFLRDLKGTLIIGFTIPVSILGTFGWMYQTGISLNLMSLGGVALAVGMLVDNSIVVLEAVHRYKTGGLPLQDAVYKGTREVAAAMVASTLTSIAVFLPLVFVVGIAGQLFRDQALTITYGQLVSLVVGFTLTPMVLAIQTRKEFHSNDERVFAIDRPLSDRPWLRRAQIVSRWCEARWRVVAHFLFVDLSQTILSDLRRFARAIGRVAARVLNPGLDAFEAAYTRFSKLYQPAVETALNHKSLVILGAFVLLGVAAYVANHLGAELIPSLRQGEFSFEIRLPEGKALEQTDHLMRTVEKEVSAYPEVETVFSSVGGSNKNQFARESKEENIGQLYVVMRAKQDKAAETRTIDRIRMRLQQYPEVAFTFSRPTLFSVKTPVEVEIYAYDLEAQRKAADLIAARLETMRGLSDIRTSTEMGNPEIQVRFDREKLARLGLDEGQVSNAVRSKIRGDVATRFREDDKQIEVLVRARESSRNTIESVQDLLLNVPPPGAGSGQAGGAGNRNAQAPAQVALTPDPQSSGPPGSASTADSERQPAQIPARSAAGTQRGVPIRLGSVAQVSVGRGPNEVRRIRSQRAAVVSANLSGNDLTSVSDAIRAELQSLRSQLPPDMNIQLGGQNEELSTSYSSLLFALALAVFLVYLVMASEFESFIHPLIILFSVPFGLVGVVFALAITGTTVSVMVLLGVIILIGIVVNNAIVLIDYTNQLRTEGYSKREALKVAGEVRLRPILMTMLSSVLGLVPMALGWGEGAEIRSPMAVTVIGGLLFSTLLTLIFIPVMYELLDRKRYPGDVTLPADEQVSDAAAGPASTV
ncbi:MAG: efflux RND transporter permease subunit [Acidobacteria bacterium]|nr:efflux RND transporter permease subunit [Acidobacteriota bacterium]